MRSISQAPLGQILVPSRSRLFRKRASNALLRRWRSTASCLVEDSEQHIPVSRRLLGIVAFGAVINIAELTCFAPPGEAVMGMTAGRVPGLAPADANGIRRYTRPEGKSGGHGVGWTEITPYFFDVYEGWEEVPVSIADPGGTEIDVKFYSDNDGGLKVVLAPVLRFANVEEGTNPTIEELIPFERFMAGFGPELTQTPVTDEDIVDKFVDKRGILTYYNFELRDHTLVSATVWKKRVYIVCLKAPARQWRSSAQKLRDTMKSFTVLTDMT
mmetsp:Transcript_605/g.2408  ORF Transcript_605/g.2408 Transcript_605/m.2408 type:complete len:271 (+) Transcript_605:173-985(+)